MNGGNHGSPDSQRDPLHFETPRGEVRSEPHLLVPWPAIARAAWFPIAVSCLLVGGLTWHAAVRAFYAGVILGPIAATPYLVFGLMATFWRRSLRTLTMTTVGFVCACPASYILCQMRDYRPSTDGFANLAAFSFFVGCASWLYLCLASSLAGIALWPLVSARVARWKHLNSTQWSSRGSPFSNRNPFE